jgi:hypothetical protein
LKSVFSGLGDPGSPPAAGADAVATQGRGHPILIVTVWIALPP